MQTPRQVEQHFIELLRREEAELLSNNRAIDSNVRRREYNRGWRERNPRYMATYARERRLRVKSDDSPRRKYKVSIDSGQAWTSVKSMRVAAGIL